MPQIWPMSWIILFLFFSLTFYFFINIVYFTELPASRGPSVVETSSKKDSLFDWKW